MSDKKDKPVKKPKYYGKKVTTPKQDDMIQDLIDKGFNIAGVINKNDDSAIRSMFRDIKADLDKEDSDGDK